MLTWQKTAVVVVIFLAIFLRFYDLESTQKFLLDEARDAFVMQKMITNGYLPLAGPTTSVGDIPLGPFYYYLMVPWLWSFALNPIGLSYGIAMMGIITVGLVYKFGQEIVGVRAALVATAFYALNPWVVNATRQAWNPHPLPLLAVIIWWLLWRSLKHPRYLAWAGLLTGLAIQLHYTAGFFLVLVVGIGAHGWWCNSNRSEWKGGTVLALLLFALTMAPWMYFQISHQLPFLAQLRAVFLQTTSMLSVNFYPHYTLVLWPLGAWMVGKGVSALVAAKRVQWSTIIVGVTLFSLSTASSYIFLSPLPITISDYQSVARIIVADAQDAKFNLLFLDPSQEYLGLSWRYFVELYNTHSALKEDYTNLDKLYVLTTLPWEVGDRALVVQKYLAAQTIRADIPKQMVQSWRVHPRMWIYKLE